MFLKEIHVLKLGTIWYNISYLSWMMQNVLDDLSQNESSEMYIYMCK